MVAIGVNSLRVRHRPLPTAVSIYTLHMEETLAPDTAFLTNYFLAQPLVGGLTFNLPEV
jgi:hypothetical protein